MFRYVLTGGHGVGKTSLALYLQLKGEYIIRESASDYKYVKMAQGDSFPFDNLNAESEIFSIQSYRENEIDSVNRPRVFLDRSIIDHFAYAKILNQVLDTTNFIENSCVYDIIFFIEESKEFGISLCTKREVEYSRFVARSIKEEYMKRNYNIVCIPPDSLEKRYKNIIEVVHEYESRF